MVHSQSVQSVVHRQSVHRGTPTSTDRPWTTDAVHLPYSLDLFILLLICRLVSGWPRTPRTCSPKGITCSQVSDDPSATGSERAHRRPTTDSHRRPTTDSHRRPTTDSHRRPTTDNSDRPPTTDATAHRWTTRGTPMAHLLDTVGQSVNPCHSVQFGAKTPCFTHGCAPFVRKLPFTLDWPYRPYWAYLGICGPPWGTPAVRVPDLHVTVHATSRCCTAVRVPLLGR